VELYWLSLSDIQEDYSITLKLLNASDQVWGQQEGRPGWDSYPTTRWTKGEVVKDVREIPIAPATPPGQYAIEVTVNEIRDERWLAPAGVAEPVLGHVEVPRTQLAQEQLEMQHRVELDFADKVRLLGYDLESGFLPGDNLHLSLFWQVLQSMDTSYTVFCHLVGPEGKVWGQKDNPPVAGYYPTNVWIGGEIVRDQYDLLIPAAAPPGDYALHIGLYLPETGERLPVMDSDGNVLGDHVATDGLRIDGK